MGLETEPTPYGQHIYTSFDDAIDRTIADDKPKENIKVRDLVVPIDEKYSLRSGCSEYNVAVVVSMDPFVLVSCRGDMRWASTVSPENFKTVGKANDIDFVMCLRRLDK